MALRSVLRPAIVCLLLLAPLAQAGTLLRVNAYYDGDDVSLTPLPERIHCVFANINSVSGARLVSVRVVWDNTYVQEFVPPPSARWSPEACHSFGVDTAGYHEACFQATNADGSFGQDCVMFRTYV